MKIIMLDQCIKQAQDGFALTTKFLTSQDLTDTLYYKAYSAELDLFIQALKACTLGG